MASQLSARHWIDGEWVDSELHAHSVNPADGETIGSYTEAGEREAQRAIAAALRAFRKTEWPQNRRLRAQVINEMADRFEARTEDLIGILSLENGKVEAEARFEVGMVPSKLRFFAALALTDFGRAMQTSPGRYTTTLREPVGVAAIIAPWNSPVVLFIRSLAPALAAGCTVAGKLPGFTRWPHHPWRGDQPAGAARDGRFAAGYAGLDGGGRGVRQALKPALLAVVWPAVAGSHRQC
jgi:betaine-aldehyde dehydrogenase